MAPRAYVIGAVRSWVGWPIGVERRPEPVGYDEVLERVLHAGCDPIASDRRYLMVRSARTVFPTLGGGRYEVTGVERGEIRRVCFDGHALDIVRTL